MENEISRNVKLGLFVAAAIVVLVIALYFIGERKNIFSSTFQISAKFSNVNGLVVGNNVRFAGIVVGTVKKIDVENDSSINVVMDIGEKLKKYIKKNSIASIGTDGFIGNKLIDIKSKPGNSPFIDEGAVIETINPIETDDVMRTLNESNQNVKFITDDLREIMQKINNSNALWSLLSDTLIAGNLKQSVRNINIASIRSTEIADDIHTITKNIRAGKGTAGSLLVDTMISYKLQKTLSDLQIIGKRTAAISENINTLTEKLLKGDGALGTMLKDTAFDRNFKESMQNINTGTKALNENLEALKHSFLLKGYFKKQEKKKK